MIFKLLIFGLLPLLCQTKLDIRIRAAKERDVSSAVAFGQDVGPLSSEERKSFKLTDSELKEYLREVEGKAPDHAYINLPGGEHKLFEKYEHLNWYPVKRVLYPESATTGDLQTKPDVIARDFLTNPSSQNNTYEATVSKTLKNTVSSKWSNSHDITVGQELEFDIIAGEVSYQYKASWGSEEGVDEEVTLTTIAGAAVTLGPGKSAKAELIANSGFMEVTIKYVAFVEGGVALDYSYPYKGHHFYYDSIQDVLLANGIPLEKEVTQKIRINFYSDITAVISDAETSDILGNLDLGVAQYIQN